VPRGRRGGRPEAVISILGAHPVSSGGASGGGPCVGVPGFLGSASAVHLVAGTAPVDAEDLDFLAGMGTNVIIRRDSWLTLRSRVDIASTISTGVARRGLDAA